MSEMAEWPRRLGLQRIVADDAIRAAAVDILSLTVAEVEKELRSAASEYRPVSTVRVEKRRMVWDDGELREARPDEKPDEWHVRGSIKVMPSEGASR